MATQNEFEPVYDEVQKYEQFPTNDARLFACLIYVLSLFTTIIGPLIIWLIKGPESEFINRAGKNYFNALISYAIWGLISCILMIIFIGFITATVLGILFFIFTIIAAVKAYNGEDYLMPLSIRFLK